VMWRGNVFRVTAVDMMSVCNIGLTPKVHFWFASIFMDTGLGVKLVL